ncbi:MAG TPA: glycerate kinase [Candidatus Binatia bacterium]|nr:glycerate kinase [Candidatus Binatia bacterium]
MPSLQDLRRDAREIFAAALKAADPIDATQRHLRIEGNLLLIGERSYDLSQYDRLFIVGAGKASARMALALQELLGERLSGGIVIVKRGYAVSVENIDIVEAGHPIPDQAGVDATEKIIALLRQTGERDLVLCPLSGGGSALLTSPVTGISLEAKQRTTEALLQCGAAIQEINSVRKHLSKVKGGRMAKLACPSDLIALILSDVVGDPIDAIASGPTAPDPSTFKNCLEIIRRYALGAKIPGLVRDFLTRGTRGEVEETPKPGDDIFDRVHNFIVGNNQLALSAARQKAEALGYHALALSSSIEGEARVVAQDHAAIARQIRSSGKPVVPPACVISGGETTVKVLGDGLGGRNQEFALSAALEIADLEGVVVLSGGTDGTDGPTDAAGGIVDSTTLKRAKTKALEARDFLDRNDSYHFLQATGDLLVTGPTFTNVMDIRLVLVA